MKTLNAPDTGDSLHRAQRWLRRRLRNEAYFQIVSGILFGLCGVIVIGVTSYCVCFATLFILLRVNALCSLIGFNVNVIRPTVVASIVLAVIVLSFTGAHKRRYGLDYSGEKVWYNSRISWNVLHASSNLVCELLFGGPRLLMLAFEQMRKATRLARTDLPGAATVLLWLLGKGVKGTVDEITAGLPGLNTVRIIPQLRDIPGVIWLVAQRGVILLSEELRRDLAAAVAAGTTIESTEPYDTESPADAFEKGREVLEWYAVFGLPAFSTITDVKRRYRTLAKMYHPDAAGEMDANGRRLAEDKMKRINDAYERIMQYTFENEPLSGNDRRGAGS